jgi:cytochrome P450
MSRNLSFRPWGGGHTLCPGQFLAKRSVKAFVAILLSKYDLKVESTSFPTADDAKPSPGVMLVGKGQDVKFRCTPRI